jgi:hypothetical protein
MRLRIGLTTLVLLLEGCAHGGGQEPIKQNPEMAAKEAPAETPPKAERDPLSEMRKDFAEERQNSNDELAQYLKQMKQSTEQPQMVRDKFTHLMDKHRSAFRDKVQKLRETLQREESLRPEDFEAEVTAQTIDFESDMREKLKEFNEQYRLYSKAFSQKPKEKKAVTGKEQ